MKLLLRNILLAFALLVVPVGLAGCGAVGKIEAAANAQNPAGLKQVYSLRATYTATFLNIASAYRSLGICPAGVQFTVQRPCAERGIVLKLQAADNAAKIALDNAEAFARKYPGKLGTSGLYEAASTAVSTAAQVVTTYNLTTY